MSHEKKDNAFLRGYCSVIELFPARSHTAIRDLIVADQGRSAHVLWNDVGQLLRGADCEHTWKEAGKSEREKLERIKARERCEAIERTEAKLREVQHW